MIGRIVFNPNDQKTRLMELESRVIGTAHPVLEFDRWLRFGKESRAQGVGTDTAGGYLVESQFSDRLYSMLKKTDPLFDPEVTTVVETATGGPFVIPILDDTTGTATIIPENEVSAIADIGPFDQLVLPKAPTWRSPLVKCSIELVQDSAYDISEMLADAFSIRFQRGIGASLVTVLLNGAEQGTTAAAAAITVDNLHDLVASVDPEYFKSKKFGWLMNVATLTAIRKLEVGAGTRIIATVYDRETRRPMIMDLPVFISPSMPNIGTGNRSVMLGDMGALIVRRVADSVRIRRFNERFATELAVGYIAYLRCNAGLARATGADSPIKWLQHS